MEIANELISGLIAGIIGLFLGVVFEAPLRRCVLRTKRWLLKRFYHPKPLPTPQTLVLGSHETTWFVIDGDGLKSYEPENLRSLVDYRPLDLPPVVGALREQIEKREAGKRERGLPYQWNGPLYAIERYAIGRTIPDEGLKLTLTFRPTDYFTFQATVMSLDVNLAEPPAVFTLRQKYLQGHNPADPISFLANGVGIALVLITKDNKLILHRRGKDVGTRQGQLDVAVVEGIHPVRDRADDNLLPDLYRTALFGATEEIGIPLLKSDIRFLGFGVDMEYYQWNMLGVAYVDQSAVEALKARTRGTGGKWETRKFEIINADPHDVFSYLKNEKIWAVGLAAIYWSLVNRWGKHEVDEAVQDVWR